MGDGDVRAWFRAELLGAEILSRLAGVSQSGIRLRRLSLYSGFGSFEVAEVFGIQSKYKASANLEW